MSTDTMPRHDGDDPCDPTPAGDVPARIRILRDHDAVDPRRDFDNLGVMYCEHRRYRLGDKGAADPRDDDGHIRADIAAWLPLYLYDHGGITMRTGPFNCPWDSGQVGIIYLTREQVKREYSWTRITSKRRATLESYLRAEVETYDQYLTGQVYGFVVENWDGDDIDSCWGFYGSDPKTNGMIDHWDTATRELYARKGAEEA